MNGDDKYGGIFKSVKQFENSTFPNNPYAVIFTDTTESLGAIPLRRDDGTPYKIKTPIYDENKNIVDYDEQVMATFPNEDLGNKAGEEIVRRIFDKAEGDPIKFASIYTGLPSDNEIVKNYASVISKGLKEQKTTENIGLAVEMLKESEKIKEYKDVLLEMYPWGEDKINEAINKGTTYSDLRKDLKRDARIQRRIYAQSTKSDDLFDLDDVGVARDAFMVGVGGIQQGFGGLLKWGGFDNAGDAIYDHAQKYMEEYYAGALSEFRKDYEFKLSDTWTPGSGFWTRVAPQILPSLIQSVGEYIAISGTTSFIGSTLRLPAIGQRIVGATKAGKNLQNVARDFYGTKKGYDALKKVNGINGVTNVVTTTALMTYSQGMQEAGRLYADLIEQGVSPEIASEQASRLVQQNMKLSGHQLTQNMLLLTKMKPVFRAKAMQYLMGVGKTSLGGTIEGYEELFQDFWYEQGKATALGTQEPEFALAFSDMSPDQKETFALGFIAGSGFDILGSGFERVKKKITSDDINRIGDEIVEIYKDKQAFKDTATTELSGNLKAFQEKINRLYKLKDKIIVSEQGGMFFDTFTEQDILDMNYSPDDDTRFVEIKETHTDESVALFQSMGINIDASAIGEKNTRYNTEVGGRQFVNRPGVSVGMSVDENTIVVGKNADPDVAIEELVESVIKQLKELDAPLYQEILEEAQRLETINTKNSGIEAISKAFVYGFLRAGDNDINGTMHPVHEQINKDNAYLSSSVTSKMLDYFVDEDGINILEEILERNQETFGEQTSDEAIANDTPTWADNVNFFDIYDKNRSTREIIEGATKQQQAQEFASRLEQIRIQKEQIQRQKDYQNQPKLLTEGSTDFYVPPTETTPQRNQVRTSARGESTRVIYDLISKPQKVKEGQLELFNDPAEDSEIIKATNEYIDFLGEQYDLFDGETFSFNPWDVEVQQEYRSEGTDINMAQGNLPQGMTALLYSGEEGTGKKWLDYGGGGSDLGVNTAKKLGNHNMMVIDFNRTEEHNEMVKEATRDGQTDVASLFNVLNVIKEDSAKINVLNRIYDALKPGGKLYIQATYKAPKQGSTQKGKSWQEGKSQKEYLPVVHSVFKDATIKNIKYIGDDGKARGVSMIVATKPKIINGKLDSFSIPMHTMSEEELLDLTGKSSHPVALFRRIIMAHQRLKKDGELTINYPTSYSKKSKAIVRNIVDKLFLPETITTLMDGTGIVIRKPKKPDKNRGYRTKKFLSPEVVQFLSMVDPDSYAEAKPSKIIYRDINIPTKEYDRTNEGLPKLMDEETYEQRLEVMIETAIEEYQPKNVKSVFKQLAEYLNQPNIDFLTIAKEWYTDGVDSAVDDIFNGELSEVWKLRDSDLESEKMFFKALVGFTSPDNAVDINWHYAVQVYKTIARNGELIVRDGVTYFQGRNQKGQYYEAKLKDAMALPIDKYLRLIAKEGSIKKAHKFMLEKQTAQKLVDTMNALYPGQKFTKSKAIEVFYEKGYRGDKGNNKYLGIEIFSPKVGSFVGNLLGSQDTSTIDLWMVRQMHRYFSETFLRDNEYVELMIVEAMTEEGGTYTSPTDPNSKAKKPPKATRQVNAPFKSQHFVLFREVFERVAKDPRMIKAYGKQPPMVYQAIGWYLEKAYYQLQDAKGQKPLQVSDYKGVQNERRKTKLQSPTYSGFGDDTKSVKILKERPKAYDTKKSTPQAPTRYADLFSQEGSFSFGLGQEVKEGITTDPASAFGMKPTFFESVRDAIFPNPMSGKSALDNIRTWSSRIRKVHPNFLKMIKKHQRTEIQLLQKYNKGFKPFIDKMVAFHKKAKKSKDPIIRGDFVVINNALLTGKDATELLQKYDMLNEYNLSKEMLEIVHKDAIEQGLDIGWIENYFPRVVKNPRQYMEYLQGKGGGNWGVISKAISDLEKEKNEPLSYEERAKVAQMVMFQQGVQGVGATSNLKKSRVIEDLTFDETEMFYHNVGTALGLYASSVANTIAIQALLGKSNLVVKQTFITKDMPNGGKKKILAYSVFDMDSQTFVGEPQNSKYQAQNELEKHMNQQRRMAGMPGFSLQASLHGWAITMIDHYDLSPEQENRLVQLMSDYFLMNKPMNPFLATIKTLSYIDTLGQFASTAVTQLGDIAMAMWKGGDEGVFRIPTGVYRATKNFAKSITNNTWDKEFITMEDLGIDIGTELTESAGTKLNKLQQFLYYIGFFTKMDAVGKETNVNAVIDKYVRASRKGKGATFDRLMFALEDNFMDVKERQEILDDLKTGKKTDNTISLAYAEILGIQPVARSEMPVAMNRYPNAKVMWMLKSFLIKRFDAFHDELRYIKYKHEKEGNADKKAKLALAYMQRLMMMGVVIALGEAGADELKDLMFGRTTSLSDRTTSAIFRLVGVSKYSYFNFKREGLSGAITKLIRPPIDFIDNPLKDLDKRLTKTDKEWEKYLDEYGLKSVRHLIPIFGKQIYWYNPETRSGKITEFFVPDDFLEKYGGGGTKRAKKYNK